MSSETNVVPLTPGRLLKGEPDPNVIELLEKFLEQARRGEVDGIAIAASRPNDMTATAFWFGNCGHRLTAAVSMVQFDVMKYAARRVQETDD